MSSIFDKYFDAFAKEIDDSCFDPNRMTDEDDEEIIIDDIDDSETEDYLMYKLMGGDKG